MGLVTTVCCHTLIWAATVIFCFALVSRGNSAHMSRINARQKLWITSTVRLLMFHFLLKNVYVMSKYMCFVFMYSVVQRS